MLLQPFTARHLQDVLRQAEEKLRLIDEVAAFRSSRVTAAGERPDESILGAEVSSHALTQVAKEFSKALAAGFDLPRVLNLFLDAVAEMVRPSRCAILLADQHGRQYRVGAFRGLVPHVVEALTLAADTGLPLWLAAEGRLIQIDEAHGRPADPAAREMAREMVLLQAVVAIPLISHGELVAILTLGQRITGGAYSRGETEILFSLGTNLATAIRDIRVHHLLQYQKEFNERILARMSNGVITIGPDETRRHHEPPRGGDPWHLGHRRAEQGSALLPSPLGDLLFETLTRSRSATRTEVRLALRNIPLEVSTYPVMGDGTEPLGAVIVFEDLTAQRQLAQEKRAAEQLQLLTRVVARIADEIKNPLVSINAFMELIGERYEDPSFRHQFSSVVGRDVRRLVQIFDKLATLVNEGDYKRDVVDLRAMAEECLVELGAQVLPEAGGDARLLSFADESTQKHVTATLSHEGPSCLVTGDRGMLKKAIAYLVWYLLRKTPGTDAKIALSISRLTGEDRLRLTVASRTAEVRAEELRSIFDPIQVVQESVLDVGPVRQPADHRGPGRATRRQTRTGRGELHGDPGGRDPVMSERPRVLVVDDELGPRESLRMILKPAYEIATAESGAVALQTLDGFHPDVVFMDIKMPQMDGIELLQQIKRIDPSIEVVMITAYASLDTVKNALTHGAFEYLIKPFSRRDLEDTARRALARRQTELGHAQPARPPRRRDALAGDEDPRPGGRGAARAGRTVAPRDPALHSPRDLPGHPRAARFRASSPRAIIKQLRDALGYDEVGVHLGTTPPASAGCAHLDRLPHRRCRPTLGYLIAANHSGHAADRPAGARVAGDALRVPRGRDPQRAPLRRDGGHQAVPGAARPVRRRRDHLGRPPRDGSRAGTPPPRASSACRRRRPSAPPDDAPARGAVCRAARRALAR